MNLRRYCKPAMDDYIVRGFVFKMPSTSSFPKGLSTEPKL